MMRGRRRSDDDEGKEEEEEEEEEEVEEEEGGLEGGGRGGGGGGIGGAAREEGEGCGDVLRRRANWASLVMASHSSRITSLKPELQERGKGEGEGLCQSGKEAAVGHKGEGPTTAAPHTSTHARAHAAVSAALPFTPCERKVRS